jgi:hypothetical protein
MADYSNDWLLMIFANIYGEPQNKLETKSYELFLKVISFMKQRWFYLTKAKEADMTAKLTWYGHAALALETGGYKLAIDPFLEEKPRRFALTRRDGGRLHPEQPRTWRSRGDMLVIVKRTGATIISVNEIAIWFENQWVKSHGQHLGGGFKHPFG